MKKLLYIAYYWPPCGGISVLRNSKLVKYFPHHEWQSIIYAPENPHYPVIDYSTEKDIPPGTIWIKHPVREPFKLFNILQGKSPAEKVQDVFLVRAEKTGITYKAGVWVRGNFFIPDARMLWIKPSISVLTHYLKAHPVDAILSSGPPHSAHRIALELKKRTGLPWIADFQDPWTQIDYFEKFMLTPYARQKHFKQEKEVLQGADKIVTVSPSWARDFERLSGKEAHSITMGYDPEDFLAKRPPAAHFNLSHFGTLGTDRNPKILWGTLSNLCAENAAFKKDLKIELAGVIDFSVLEAIQNAGLKENLVHHPYLKREEAIAKMQSSAVLLLLLNKGYGSYNVLGRIPAKLFEYFGAARQTLVIGPSESDVAHIVAQTHSGITVNNDDRETLRKAILDFYAAWREGRQLYEPQNIAQYNFEHLAGKMATLLDEI